MPDNKLPTKLPPPRNKSLLPLALLFIGLLVVVIMVTSNRGQKEVRWSAFLDEVRQGHVQKIIAEKSLIQVERSAEGLDVHKASKYHVYYPGTMSTDQNLEELRGAILTAEDKNFEVVLGGVAAAGPWGGILLQMLVLVAVFFLLWLFFFRRMGQGGGVLSFGKSRATLVTKGKTGKTFDNVAGIDEAKDEVEELVEFLKQPKKFQKLGGRIPRGVLLVGPPGTGKTLLAKAIAGEADVPFYSISGSDFVEMFVGVGASRVRDLFQQAKDNSPCIIFIDEIDAVARKRGSGMSSGGHDEREQTLNAILVEMDGFASNDKVIVIAATNRLDVLDPALIRPGRFDRHINVNLPDITGREQILGVHSGKVTLAADVDMSVIARGTPGFSGADLENLINEGALQAARHNKDAVYHADLEYARDRVAFGRERKVGAAAMPPEERKITAYHEAGHTIISCILPEVDEFHKVSIIPRGRALGATMMLPKDRYTHSRKKLLGDICGLFGGRIAEDVFCGDITSGASNDIERATGIARAMVYELGMSDKMGPVRYTVDQEGYSGSQSYVDASSATRRELDEEVRRILDSQYERAEDIIKEHSAELERIAEGLLEYETLSNVQVTTLIEGGELEPRPVTVSLDRPEKSEEDTESSTEKAPEADPESESGMQPKLA